MPESDRDILIELRTKVTDIHRDMTQPEGRVPRLEGKVEDHAAHLNRLSGAQSTAKWFLAGIGTILLALATLFVQHVLGGK